MNKLKSGQILYRDMNARIVEWKIDKVGLKYFTVKNSNHRFLIETLTVVNDGYDYRLYLTEQEIKDMNEKKGLLLWINRYFNGYGTELSIEKLRQLKSIIES